MIWLLPAAFAAFTPLDVELYRREAGGQWRPLRYDEVVADGDELKLRVVAGSAGHVYLTLYPAGTNGGAWAVCPAHDPTKCADGTSPPVSVGQAVEFGPFTLEPPLGLEWVDIGWSATPIPLAETVRLCGTPGTGAQAHLSQAPPGSKGLYAPAESALLATCRERTFGALVTPGYWVSFPLRHEAEHRR